MVPVNTYVNVNKNVWPAMDANMRESSYTHHDHKKDLHFIHVISGLDVFGWSNSLLYKLFVDTIAPYSMDINVIWH